jgi:hypothetical protein
MTVWQELVQLCEACISQRRDLTVTVVIHYVIDGLPCPGVVRLSLCMQL